MSVICSDSEDDTNENQVAIQCKAYLSGGKVPTTCFLPSSPKRPVAPSKFRRFTTSPSTSPKYQPMESVTAHKHVSMVAVNTSAENRKAAIIDRHRAIGFSSRQYHNPNDMQSAPGSKAKPQYPVNVINETIATRNRSHDEMKSSMHEPSPSWETNTQTKHTLISQNQPTISPSHTRKRTQNHSSTRCPIRQSPRKRRKKPQNPLPPYGPLMRDTSDDDIATYSSDDTDAIRYKSTLMLQNLRQAHLEHHWSKMEEIEKWRKETNDGI